MTLTGFKVDPVIVPPLHEYVVAPEAVNEDATPEQTLVGFADAVTLGKEFIATVVVTAGLTCAPTVMTKL